MMKMLLPALFPVMDKLTVAVKTQKHNIQIEKQTFTNWRLLCCCKKPKHMHLYIAMLPNTSKKPTTILTLSALAKAETDERISLNLWNNKCLKDIPGEKWKEVPGTEGYYLISNYGRVKALSRMLVNKLGVSRFYKERILQQVVLRYKNETAGDHIPELVTSASFCGKGIRIHIARMVFELFVNGESANTITFVVLHKNGDRYDNRDYNLYTASFSEKMKDVYTNKREHSVSDYHTEDSKKLVSLKLSKKVTQYDCNGVRIAIYDSIKEAADDVDVHPGYISFYAANNKLRFYHGSIWRKGIIMQDINMNVRSKKV